MPRQVRIQNLNHPFEHSLLAGYCESFFCRLRGLTFRSRLAPSEGLLLVQRQESCLDAAIHMLAVFMDLAIIWINADYIVIDTIHAKAWHPAYFPKRPAKYILEIHPDRIEDFKIGDKVTFIND